MPIYEPSPDWLRQEGCPPTDLQSLLTRLTGTSSRLGYRSNALGNISGDPIILLTRDNLNPGPNLLIAAGFHGDEPGGPWGILRFLEALHQALNVCNVSFLPLVNPSGFRRRTRRNELDQDPNRGFCHAPSGKAETSTEGQILLDHLPRLKQLAGDGFLSLHEDPELQQFYVYVMEHGSMARTLALALTTTEERFFRPHPDGPLEGGIAKGGAIFDLHDGSFEDMLFHEGIPAIACTETPGQADVNVRVEAHSDLIGAFIDFAVSQKSQHSRD